MSSALHETTVRSVTPVGERIYILHIDTPHIDTSHSDKLHSDKLRGFRYQAGQYVEIGFGSLSPRMYSIANAPGASFLEIHIKDSGGAATQYVASVLQAGDKVTLGQPGGHSVYDPADDRPVIALANGLGFTPVKAIIEAAALDGFPVPFRFIWRCAEEEERYMKAHFEELAREHENFSFVFTGADYFDTVLDQRLDDLQKFKFYIAGAPAMIESVSKSLQERGVDRGRLFHDNHPEAAEKVPAS